ncbi:hypothetical protein F5Y10DRAFT_246292 [Nemania abortiva]|nr:hypothetical protein F5Y10DRAFT_246292 [Nemania abortiva]
MSSQQASTSQPSDQTPAPRHIDGLNRLREEAYKLGLGYLWRRFESKQQDLFDYDPAGIPTNTTAGVPASGPVKGIVKRKVSVVIPKGDEPIEVSTPEELHDAVGDASSKLIIVNRFNSWSRMDITLKCFSAVCHLADIQPWFLHFVFGVEHKIESKDEDFMSCYSTVTEQRDPPVPAVAGNSDAPVPAAAEESGPPVPAVSEPKTNSDDPKIGSSIPDPIWALCYNIRHFEKHGREDPEDPWSCRQSVLHHSFLPASGQSSWVVIQPPEAFDLTVGVEPHPMSLHIRYLYAALANWREYLEYLARILEKENSRIAGSQKHFSDNCVRNVHYTRRRIHHAHSILINTKATFQLITEHECAVAWKHNIDPTVYDDFQRKMRNLSRELDNYVTTSHKLLRMSDDIKSIYENSVLVHQVYKSRCSH